MSGYKRATVSISQEEYNRLRDAEGKLRSLPPPSIEAIQAVKDQSYGLLQFNLETIEKRQARFQDFLMGLDSAIQSAEKNTNEQLKEIEFQTAARVQEHIGNLQQSFSDLLQEQQAQFEEVVYHLHCQEQAQIASFSEELDQIVQEQSQKREIARGWLDTCEGLLSFIRENYAPDFFSPQILYGFEQQLEQFEVNYQHRFYDAVLVASQQSFYELSLYRLELEQQHNEWFFLYQSAWETLSQELIQVENSAYVPALDLEGNELSSLVDVNFWNPGDLEQLYQEISELDHQLADQDSLPGISTLRLWLDTVLPDCRQKLERTILDARVKAINSQLRINVADLIVQALQQQGFSLASSAYNDYDLRLGYGARLTNIEGNEVIVQLTPNGTGIGENELHIQSYDSEEKTEHELHRRWQEMSQSLICYGIEVGHYEKLDLPRRAPRPSQGIHERRSQYQVPVKNGIANGN
jgi:hypothetical protein